MHTKWKKIFIGLILIIAFISYTQFQKSAEPTWKVNTEKFQVADSWNELMKLEESKFQDLKFVNHFHLLKDSKIIIPIPNEQREFKIEKTWYYANQLYILYSVDLLERDKNLDDIPKLFVDKIKLSSSNGDSLETPAESYNGEISLDGYVYKHRVYRSVILRSNFENVNEEADWEKIIKSDRLEFTKLSLYSKKGTIKLDPISFKVTPANVNEEPIIISSEPINKIVTLNNNKEIKIGNLQFYQMGSRLSVVQQDDPTLISLVGNFKKYFRDSDEEVNSFEYQISNDGKGRSYIETYGIINDLISLDKKERAEIIISHSIHRTNTSHDFTVSKEDINKLKANPNEDVVRNIVIFNENGIKGAYSGLTLDPETKKPVIKFTLTTVSNAFDYLIYPRPKYHFIDMKSEESNLTNLVSVKNLDGKNYENFEIHDNFEQGEQAFFIDFNKGLPTEELTVTLSNLVSFEPLKKAVVIPLKIPQR
ncbi:hypothetical protein [Bacillus sp. NEB1478]|uniref:hypothetical protein n=1 Tax=Bacillus sp. NEB1478 TaxID=3073816 RepID=UPI002872E406|nr:hypothetical protein [Bacillus sp. NEB1478]WNB90237.1 hypothetical protein RGB74_09900 [Bacillus sp. NEB1478]